MHFSNEKNKEFRSFGALPFREKISINNEHGEALACACAAVFWVESLKNVEYYAAQKGHQDPRCSHHEMPTGGPVMCQVQGTHDRNRTQCRYSWSLSLSRRGTGEALRAYFSLRTKHCCEGEDWLTAMPKHLLSPRGQDSITGKEGDETMPKGLCCSFHVPDVSQNVTGMAWYTDLTLKDNKAFSYFNWGFDLKIFYTMLLARMATVFSLGSTALCSKGPVTPHQQSMAQSMC